MPPSRQSFYLAWGALHFALIVLVCLHETFSLFRRSPTLAPGAWKGVWEVLDRVPATLFDSGSGGRGWASKTLATYTNASGIEVGYGYFAPNVPLTHALVFECHYSDGRVAYETPALDGAEEQLRLSSLIEEIGQTEYSEWREALVRMLARSTWRRYPQVVSMRAFLGSIAPPTVGEYTAGKRERTFRCLYVYDFGRDQPAAGKPTP